MKRQRDERDQQQRAIDAETEGTGRLRAGVDAARDGLERTRDGVEDAAWLARARVRLPGVGTVDWLSENVGGRDGRARVGIFADGAVTPGALVAAVIVATSGSSSSGGATTEAL